MTTIFLINQTLLLLPNQSLSIEYKQFSCLSNITVRLIIHLVASRIVEHVHFSPLVAILCHLRIMSFYCDRRDPGHSMTSYWTDIHHPDRYSIITIVMKKEFQLILVYACAVLFGTWLGIINNNDRIRYFYIVQWFVETSFLPEICIVTVLDYFLSNDFFEMYYRLYVPMIRMKIFFFIFMRINQWESFWIFDTLEKFLFDVYCYRFRK